MLMGFQSSTQETDMEVQSRCLICGAKSIRNRKEAEGSVCCVARRFSIEFFGPVVDHDQKREQAEIKMRSVSLLVGSARFAGFQPA
jgi:hypothetical protein